MTSPSSSFQSLAQQRRQRHAHLASSIAQLKSSSREEQPRTPSTATSALNAQISLGQTIAADSDSHSSQLSQDTRPGDDQPKEVTVVTEVTEGMEMSAIHSVRPSASVLVDANRLPNYPDFPGDLVEIRESAERGRGVYVKNGESSRGLRRGTTLLATSPLSAVLSTANIPHYCTYCWLSPYELSVQHGQMGLAAENTYHQSTSSSDKGKQVVRHQADQPQFTLKRCTGCKVVRYCTEKCQSLDWEVHRHECRALTRLRKMKAGDVVEPTDLSWLPGESVRALGRILWRRKEDIKAGKRQMQREPFAALAMSLSQYLSAAEFPPQDVPEGHIPPADMREFGLEGVVQLMDLCCSFATNSFTLSSPSLTALGVAISPLVALFNHSCRPNAVVVFPGGGRMNKGKGMQVNVIQDIAPGEEIVTAYIDVSLPYDLRQKSLKDAYHFDCRCELCREDAMQTGVDPRWAVKHPGCTKDGLAPLPDLAMLSSVEVECSQCKSSFSVDVPSLNQAIEEGRLILEADQKGNFAPSQAQRLPSILRDLLAFLPPSSYPVFPLLRLQALLDTTPSADGTSVIEPARAIQATALAWRGMAMTHPDGHPSLGIILAELGKLLNLDTDDSARSTQNQRSITDSNDSLSIPTDLVGRRQLTATILQKASEQLEIGFGVGGGLVGTEVKGLSAGLQYELKMLGDLGANGGRRRLQ